MKLQHFIDRPILSIVISVVILVAGLIGLYALSVEQYPDIAPPTIRVSTTYSGANAEAVQKSVIVPLEEAINGVENMTYMTSTASNTGSAEITVYFKQGSDPDMAAVNVQNKVSTATSLLPAEVTKVGVTTMKRQSSMLKIFGLYSPNGTYDRNFLTNYLSINVKPQIQRISGVGEVNVMGGGYAMRIWLKPDVMAQYELEPSDVEAAISSQNIEASTGSIGEDSKNVYQYTLKYRERLEKEQEFEVAVPEQEEKDGVLFVQFRIENKKPKEDIEISLEGERNKLSSIQHVYYNRNTVFTYAVVLGKGQKTVRLSLGKGEYTIKDMSAYNGVLNEDTGLYQSVFRVDKKQTKGNLIQGRIKTQKEGMFITSIQFDKQL